MIKKRIKNMTFLVWEKLFKLFLNLFWIALLSRYLGPEKFGEYSYLFALMIFFSILPQFGLDNVNLDHLIDGKKKILKVSFLIRSALALFSAVIFFVYISVSEGKTDYITALYIFLIFFSLNVDLIKNYHQAYENTSRYIHLDNIAISIALLIKMIMLKNEYINIPLLISLDYIAPFLLLLFFSRKLLLELWSYNCVLIDLMRTIKIAFPFFISSLLVVIYTKIDQIMIKELIGYKELGIYAASARISTAWWVIPTVLTVAFYPSFKKIYGLLPEKRIVSSYFSIILYSALFCAIPIFFLAYFLIINIFGEQYIEAVNLVKMHCFVGCLAALGVARSKWFIMENMQKYLPVFIGGGAVFNIVLNYFLIPKLGAYGAVLSTIAAQAAVQYIFPLFFESTRKSVSYCVYALFPNVLIYGVKNIILGIKNEK
ncbi:TPA: oligosaccharide flippase family protein [Vibrio cholerae]